MIFNLSTINKIKSGVKPKPATVNPLKTTVKPTTSPVGGDRFKSLMLNAPKKTVSAYGSTLYNRVGGPDENARRRIAAATAKLKEKNVNLAKSGFQSTSKTGATVMPSQTNLRGAMAAAADTRLKKLQGSSY